MVSGFGVQQMHCRTLDGRTNCTRAAAELVVKCGMPSLLQVSEWFQGSNCETQAPFLDKSLDEGPLCEAHTLHLDCV